MADEYRAFISYSHAAEGALAAALQRDLQRIGKPWYRRSQVKVFRDTTSLAADPALWPAIERHLARCTWFVLMASPAAAASPWVGREIDWWLAHRGTDRLLIVLCDGDLQWDDRQGGFDAPRSSALPSALHGRFSAEPLYVDLRWARGSAAPTMRDARYRNAVLSLAAPLHGRARDELDSEEIRQHRRFVATASMAGAGMLVLAVLAGFAGWQARQESVRAEASWREAESRRLATRAVEVLARDQQTGDALKIAVMARSLAPTAEAIAALERLAGATAAMAGILGQHTGGLAALAFSDDSRQLATLGRDGSLQLWRTGDWQRVAGVLPGALRNGVGLRFNDNGTHLLAWDDGGSLELWDLAAKQRSEVSGNVPGDMFGRTAAVSPGAAWLAVSGRPGVLAAWDVRAKAWRQPPTRLGEQRVVGLRFDDDTRLRVALVDRTLRIAVWDLAKGSWTQGVPSESFAMLAYTTEAAFAPGGRRLLTLGDGAGFVFDVDATLKPRPLARLEQLRSCRVAVAYLDATGRQAMLRHHGSWSRIDLAQPDAPAAQGSIAWTTCSTWSPDLRWRADTPAMQRSGEEARGERLLLWDQQAATKPAQALDTACGFGEDSGRCLQRLCEKLSPTLDEGQLRALFGVEDFAQRYDRYRRVIGGPPCGSAAR